MGQLSRLTHRRRRRIVVTAVATAFSLLVGSSEVAFAGEPSAPSLVLPTNTEGDVPEPMRDAIAAAVVEALTRGGAALRSSASTAPCGDTACVARRLGDASLSRAVATQVEAQGPDQHIVVRVHDETGAELAMAEATCDMCGLKEAAIVAADVASIAWRRAQAPASTGARLELRGTPVGALVEVDGQPVGLLPYDGELSPGPHEVTVSRRGYFQSSSTVSLVEGETEALDLTLVEIPPDTQRRARRLRVGGLVSMGGGLALAGTGAALFVGDGREYRRRCSGADVDADGDCRQRWNTMPGAIAATSLGAAALITGAVLLGVGVRMDRAERARRGDHPVSVRPTAGGLRVRF